MSENCLHNCIPTCLFLVKEYGAFLPDFWRLSDSPASDSMNCKFSASLIISGPMILNQEMLKVTGACSLTEQRRSIWKSPLPVLQWVLLDGPAARNRQDFESSEALISGSVSRSHYHTVTVSLD